MTDTPKRRGPPLKASSERKRNSLTFRARDALRTRLEEAAKDNGNSVSEEIENRLSKSFERQEAENIFASAFVSEALRSAALMMGLLERTYSIDYRKSSSARKRASELFSAILEAEAAGSDWLPAFYGQTKAEFDAATDEVPWQPNEFGGEIRTVKRKLPKLTD